MTNNKINLTEKQKQLIQKFGVHMEKSGMTLVEAKILGLLLISPETELTFEQVKDTLLISKSATSNALKRLTDLGQIEYITKHGDRKRYFKAIIEMWQKKLEERLEGLLTIKSIMKEILEARPNTNKTFNKNLQSLINYIEFFNKEMLLISNKWKNRK